MNLILSRNLVFIITWQSFCVKSFFIYLSCKSAYERSFPCIYSDFRNPYGTGLFTAPAHPAPGYQTPTGQHPGTEGTAIAYSPENH